MPADWIRSALTRITPGPRRNRNGRLPSSRRPRLDPLEDRTVPATFTVNTTADTVDVNPGDGLARDSAGNTSLRAAVMEANALAGADTISVPAGTYRLTLAGSGNGSAASGDLDITGDLTIQGAATGVTEISAAGLGDRIFDLPQGAGLNNRRVVNLDRLQLTDGVAQGTGSSSTLEDRGGALRIDFYNTVTITNGTFLRNTAPRTAPGLVFGLGGAIDNNGFLTIADSRFDGNQASNGGGAIYGGGSPAQVTIRNTTFTNNTSRGGGAIKNHEPMTIENSTFSGNNGGNGGGSGQGGAIDNNGGGNLTLTNCTLSGNAATFGGAVYNADHLRLLNTTVAGNTSAFAGGGLYTPGSTTTLENSIVATNTAATEGPDIDGTVTSAGHNLIGNTAASGGFGATDLLNVDPRLGPLAGNGGPTQTMALLAGSPALDAANTATAPAADQRGVARPQGPAADIGAFELAATGNRPPNAANDAYATDEDTALTVAAPGVLANDTDPDGNAITAVLVTGPAHGTLTLNANGSFTYRPARNYNGPDSFTYKANDGTADSNVATVSLTVNSINDPPLGIPQTLTTPEETAVSGQARGLDFDGDPLTFSLERAPDHGTVTLNPDGTFTYTPALDFNGQDGFLFRVTDPSGASGVSGVVVNVTPVNDAPAAADDAYAVDEDGTLVVGAGPAVSRLHMISDPGDFVGQGLVWDFDPTTAAFSARTNFDNGVEVTVDPPGAVEEWDLNFAAPGDVPLTPGTYLGATRWPFQAATDPGLDVSGYGRGLNRLVGQFTVYDVGYGPAGGVTRFAATFVQQDDPFTGPDGPPLYGAVVFNSTFGAGRGVLANDTDVEGELLLGATLVTSPVHGDLAFNRDGSFVYTPQPNFHGTDSFTYRTADARADSAVATVTINVNAVNDPPVAADGSAATDEDTALNGNVSATDVDGDALTYSLVSGPSHGTLALNGNGSFTYTPSADYNGSDSFTFQANDGTVDSNTATFALTVRPVNDAPVANSASFTTDEDTALTGNVSATDVEGDALTFALVTGPAHGTLALGADGSFTYTPAANYNGSDAFTFRANDGAANSNTATVSLTVNPVNDAPAAADDTATTDEDTAATVAVLANDTDVDGDTLTVSAVGAPAHGAVVLNADGTVTYTPAADYNGADAFTYTASDGHGGTSSATVRLTVRPVNDAPVAAADAAATDEDTQVTVNVLANDTDVDGDPLRSLLVSGPGHGTVVRNTDGTFTYTPAANFNGTDSFTYKASDGTLSSSAATVTITVRPVNDAPAAANDTYSTTEGTVLDVSAPGVLRNDADVDGDALSAVLVSGPANGTLTFNPDGSFRYTPETGFSGTDTFTYKVTDGSLESGVATVTLQVAAAANTEGAATGGGSVDHGRRRFTVNVQSKRRANGTLALSGTLTFNDLDRSLRLTSTAIRSFHVDATGTRAVIAGTARVNGRIGYTFVATVEDVREPGDGADTFRILITGPNGFQYDSLDATGLATLTQGNVQVRKKA